MPAWRSLTDLVVPVRERLLAGKPSLPLDLRQAAALVALDCWGRTVTEQPSLVNVAALALSTRERLVVHEVRGSVVQLVGATDLHALPGRPPRLLRRPFILEASRPDKGGLVEGTGSLGGYEIDGAIYLIGLGYPDGVRVASWRPRWGEADLEAGVQRDASPLIDDVDAHHEWSREAARLLVVLGLLLDAEGAPLRTDDERHEAAPRGRPSAGKPAPAWTTRRVFVDEQKTHGRWGDGGGDASAEGMEGRLPEEVAVKGHLKRQVCGPGGTDRKWIYVESYEARRWVAPRPARVVVGARDE